MPPRVAYFPDSFHEVNGVAHTSRNFVAFAERHGIEMLCVRAGKKTQVCAAKGSVQALELGARRWPCRWSATFTLTRCFFATRDSYQRRCVNSGRRSSTSPGRARLGIFGAYFAWKLKIPLVASWHTNVHEYAARRLGWLTRHIGVLGGRIESAVEAGVMEATSRFYRLAKVLYAPNPGLCALLERKTGRPVRLMQRGVETGLFAPQHRTREPLDGRLVLGYVGRLSVEKNVALIAARGPRVRARGIIAEWLIVGHGAEDEMLRRGLPGVKLAGVLRGEALAEACANMDLLVFPSHAGHLRQRGAGGTGQRRSGRGHARRRASEHRAGPRDGTHRQRRGLRGRNRRVARVARGVPGHARHSAGLCDAVHVGRGV